jgi:hypothetical protein
MGIYKSVIHRTTPLLMIMVMMAALPATAEAAVKVFRPDNFKPVFLDDGIHGTVQYGSYLSAANSNGQIYRSRLKLPAGSRITGITMFYKGMNTFDGGYFEIKRIKQGQDFEWAGSVMVQDDQNTGKVETIKSDEDDIPHPVIQKNYRYYIRVKLDTSQSRFHGAKVFYKKP